MEIARVMLIRLRRSRRFKAVGQALGRMWRSNRQAVVSEGLSPALRATLVEAFADDVRILSRIFGRDLRHWLEDGVEAEAPEPAGPTALQVALG